MFTFYDTVSLKNGLPGIACRKINETPELNN